jgi:hypothetical protein
MNPVAFLVMQEMAQGRSTRTVALGLDVSESDLDALCDSVTGDEGGTKGPTWQNGIAYLKSMLIGNQQTIAQGWDALEAMTLDSLARKVQDAGMSLKVSEAVSIAQVANKAIRRHSGEGGGGPRTQVNINRGNGFAEEDMSLELRSGNLGSIRLSLSTRVRAQLEQPKTIEVEARQSAGNREMLDLEETRKLVGGS